MTPNIEVKLRTDSPDQRRVFEAARPLLPPGVALREPNVLTVLGAAHEDDAMDRAVAVLDAAKRAAGLPDVEMHPSVGLGLW